MIEASLDPEEVVSVPATRVSRVAWSLWVAFLLVGAAGLALRARSGELVWQEVLLGVALSGYVTVGSLIASRQPLNPLGWLFIWFGLGPAIWAFARGYATYALVTEPGSLPAADWMAWLQTWVSIPSFFVGMIFFALLYPTGRLPSPRWRPVAWIALLMLVVGVPMEALQSGPIEEFKMVDNPVGVFGDPFTALHEFGWLAFVAVPPLLMFAAAASLVLRYRRSRGEERQQLKWFTYGTMLIVVLLPFAVVGASGRDEIDQIVLPAAAITLAGLVPVAVGIAILKHNLYDIDVVINKTILFGVLAAFIVGVYALIVVGLGSLVGGGGEPNIGLSVAATAVVAIAFEPVRARTQRIANRLVYGHRASPEEVLRQFSRGLTAVSGQDGAPRMARVVAEGTGASCVEVWMRVGQAVSLMATWPERERDERQLDLLEGETPPIDGAERVVPVRLHGELLGAIVLYKKAGDPIRPAEEKLLADLGAQAGLVLRNIRLTTELEARLEEVAEQADELRASRQRIVAIQDVERRKLERNIHDGAQQHLVALVIKLGLVKKLATQNVDAARALVRELRGESAEAMEVIRDLARGIYPTALAAHGLAAAIEAQARKAPFLVAVHAEDLRRYPEEVEGTVYFACLEALQNASKYARPTRVDIRIWEQDGSLRFEVSDDGVGFDPATTPSGSGLGNLEERLAALGGRAAARSAPGDGTVVTGSLPLAPEAIRV